MVLIVYVQGTLENQVGKTSESYRAALGKHLLSNAWSGSVAIFRENSTCTRPAAAMLLDSSQCKLPTQKSEHAFGMDEPNHEDGMFKGNPQPFR